LKGTGVPFPLAKYRIDHRTRNNPVPRIGIDATIVHDVGSSLGTPKNLSRQSETTINSATKVRKKASPAGVRRVRTFLLPVAAL